MIRSRRLPPLKALHAFEAVGRLGSVTAAAAELGVTQPALSQHVRALEERLGTSLFERRGGRLALTGEGRAYHRTIAEAFDRIAEETDRVSAPDAGQITVAGNFGFTHFWLQPRLSRLEAEMPQARLRIVSADREDADEMRRADVTIRFGDFDRLGPRERALMPSRVRPVCSPAFAARHGLDGGADGARRLAELPLLHMDEHDPRWLDWEGWLRAQGLPPPASRASFIYNNYPLLVSAACAGHGVALGWMGLVDAFLQDGRLVPCGPEVDQRGRGYVLAARTAAPRVSAVAEWIVAACCGEGVGVAAG